MNLHYIHLTLYEIHHLPDYLIRDWNQVKKHTVIWVVPYILFKYLYHFNFLPDLYSFPSALRLTKNWQ